MNPEERRMLERALALAEQNNRILKGMRRAVMMGRLLHLLYWVVIIAISIASYYYLQPYIGNLTSAVQAVEQIRGIQY